jgi:hypothetical protein
MAGRLPALPREVERVAASFDEGPQQELATVTSPGCSSGCDTPGPWSSGIARELRKHVAAILEREIAELEGTG